jgi:energy-coupling factor transporter transmembrane protein EcfT
MIDRRFRIGILVVAIVALVVGILTVPQKDYMSIIHSVCVGFVLSAIFYFVVVFLPESCRKRMICSAFAEQYNQFRSNCIGTFLILSNSQEYQQRENLLDKSEFQRYFKNNYASGKNRWDEVAKGIQGNEFYLREIVYELRMFNEEIKYIRNAVYLGDSEVFSFLNRLSQAIHRYELTQPEYDDIKSFCGFLWSVFTGWNFVDGYENRDYIEKMLAKATKT